MLGSPARRSRDCHRLQQGGEQQRRDARHDDDVDNAQDARDQVEADGQQQQPPGPRGRRGQPARHAALLGTGAVRGAGSWTRLRASIARAIELADGRAPGDLLLDARTASDPLLFVGSAVASLAPGGPVNWRPVLGTALRLLPRPQPCRGSCCTATALRASYSCATPVIGRTIGLTGPGRATRAHGCPPGRSAPSPGLPGRPPHSPRHDSIRPTTLECMRDYRERLYVPLVWWLLAIPTILILGGTLYAGLPWPWPIIIFAGLPSSARRRSSASARPRSRSTTDRCAPGRPCCRWRRSAR